MTELNFKGKEFVYNHHLAVPFRPLVPHEEKGIGPVAFDGNLVINGDNLHALKALLPLYAGKVDCVFIDPPYNTGNENWSYNDNVRAPMIKAWLESNPIGVEDNLRHDKWCVMMWPRLRLLHELLADEGSIWITLDDNEIHRARLVMDEVFGEQAFICTIATQSNKRGHTYNQIAKTHEYILVYGKTEFAELREIETGGANLPQEDSFGPYSSRELRNRNPKYGRHNRPNLFYPFFASDERIDSDGNYILSLEKFECAEEILPMNSSGGESCWRWSKDTSAIKIQGGSTEFIFGAKTRDGNWRVFEKYRKKTVKSKTIWSDNKHILEQGTKELGQIGLGDLFQFPKPLGIIEDVLAIATSEGSLVLDSFAGSGTTAHAVLEANRRDDGHRRFILVEMEDYADRLTAERVRRVMCGYEFQGIQRTELMRKNITWTRFRNSAQILKQVEELESLHSHEYERIKKSVKNGELVVTGENEVDEQAEGVGGTFTYCTLGDPIELDKLLNGETLPPFASIGAALFHMATNRALDPTTVREDAFYLGETEREHVWLIYRADLEWLKTSDSALTLARAKQFSSTDPEKIHLVIAPARYVSQKMLTEQNLSVEYVPLPYALYRIDRN